MTKMKLVLFALLTAAVLAACSTDQASLETMAHRDAEVFRAPLAELNDSGGEGQATLVARGDSVRVNVHVSGLLADATHLQHIHGFTDDAAARCPTAAEDVDGDGLVNLLEGAAVYGPILTTLGTDTGASFEYSRVFDLAPVSPLAQRHIIVHGVDVDGNGELTGQKDINDDGEIGGTDNPVLNLTEAAFELTLPALCGELALAGGA